MRSEPVRIGGASGFWGDSPIALPQLLRSGDVQYIVFDYLAELTMSLLAAARQKNPAMGYATDFVDGVSPLLHELLEKKVRLVSNAGGVNPHACAEALHAAADKAGVKLRIAVVEGDDVLALVPSLKEEGVCEMQSGQHLPQVIQTASAYLGAFPIRDALDAGADIVILGRCVDSAVTLGVLMHAFQWSDDDLDKLAMGSLAGHIIECGCQATGGLHTDWHNVPDWAGIGYPIVEVSASGDFVVTKPTGTGGLVSVPVIAEQILYEIADPANYLLPDVVCDFTQVRLAQAAVDCVSVQGAKGKLPTNTYKVCATWPDGFRTTAQLTIVGFEATAKARRTADAILERTRRQLAERGLGDFAAVEVEVLGAESGYGPHSVASDVREVVLRMAVRHPERSALEIFAREIAPAGTGGAPGTVVMGGRPAVARVLRQFSFLLAKDRVPVHICLDGVRVAVQAPKGNPRTAALPPGPMNTPPPVESEMREGGDVTVPLIAIAWGRSGDKGDNCNVGIVARSPELYAVLALELTGERVRSHLAHLVNGKVTRFEVPGFHAFNFVCERALGGGGMASLRNDPWGKSIAQILLAMPVNIPADLANALPQPRPAHLMCPANELLENVKWI